MISSMSGASNIHASVQVDARATELAIGNNVSVIRATANSSSSTIMMRAGPVSSETGVSPPPNLLQIPSRTRSSSIIRFSRTSERTRANSATSFTGLVRKSSAPASRPRRRLAVSDSAVTMTTGTSRVRRLAFSWRQTSNPSIRGIMTSRRITSGISVSAISRAVGPLYAVKTSKYSLDSFASSSFTFASISSTTSTRPDISLSHQGSGRAPLSGEEALDGLQKARHRDRLRDVRLAAAVPHFFLIALHREGGHRDDRDHPQISVSLDPLRDLQTGYFRQLDVHEDQIRTMLTSKRKCLDTVLGLQCTIAVSDEKVVEELHIEVVILNDQHLLPYRLIGVHLRFSNVQCH